MAEMIHNYNHAEILQGQVRWCEFPRDNHCLLGGKRPGVILSNDMANKGCGSVLVCPCTTKSKKALPVHVELIGSVALLEEITVLPKENVHDVIYDLDWRKRREIKTALLVEFGII